MACIHARLPDGLIVHLSSLLQHFGGKAEIICAPLFLASSSNWTMNKLANWLMVFFCLKRRLMGEMRARACVHLDDAEGGRGGNRTSLRARAWLGAEIQETRVRLGEDKNENTTLGQLCQVMRRRKRRRWTSQNMKRISAVIDVNWYNNSGQ